MGLSSLGGSNQSPSKYQGKVDGFMVTLYQARSDQTRWTVIRYNLKVR